MKVLGGKGWFSCEVGVEVRFVSLMVWVGEEFMVLGLG